MIVTPVSKLGGVPSRPSALGGCGRESNRGQVEKRSAPRVPRRSPRYVADDAHAVKAALPSYGMSDRVRSGGIAGQKAATPILQPVRAIQPFAATWPRREPSLLGNDTSCGAKEIELRRYAERLRSEVRTAH